MFASVFLSGHNEWLPLLSQKQEGERSVGKALAAHHAVPHTGPSSSLQVVCGSKYLVRGESALDHVDLLASSRHWPPIYVVDMATPVALCADLCYPELTNQMWGRNQGCFSSPTEPPVVSSLPRNSRSALSHIPPHASAAWKGLWKL